MKAWRARTLVGSLCLPSLLAVVACGGDSETGSGGSASSASSSSSTGGAGGGGGQGTGGSGTGGGTGGAEPTAFTVANISGVTAGAIESESSVAVTKDGVAAAAWISL